MHIHCVCTVLERYVSQRTITKIHTISSTLNHVNLYTLCKLEIKKTAFDNGFENGILFSLLFIFAIYIYSNSQFHSDNLHKHTTIIITQGNYF